MVEWHQHGSCLGYDGFHEQRTITERVDNLQLEGKSVSSCSGDFSRVKGELVIWSGAFQLMRNV